MSPSRKKSRGERDETDRALGAEREKTDTELAKSTAGSEKKADAIVGAARAKADASVAAARRSADDSLGSDVTAAKMRRALTEERSSEDRVLAAERRTEDTKLSSERAEVNDALRALLHLEREATDHRLRLERERSDAEVVARDDFLGMVSHDLRTLLGGIALQAAFIARPGPSAVATEGMPPRALKAADAIQRYTARMNRLIGDLIDVVSIEEGKLHVQPERHEATALLRDVTESFSPLAAAKGIELTTEMEGGALLARFDHDRILQVLANLLSNALKFTDAGGRVVVRVVSKSDDEVLFCVKDTGTGIAGEKIPAIFERFWQVTPDDRRGLGLGLFISKCIVEAHGGRIWVESTPAVGSSFFFTLPAAGR